MKELRAIRISVTSEDGELLDTIMIEIPDDSSMRYIAIRPVNYSIGQREGEEILDIGA